ncbi:UNVERIFIED_CONTAM: hypothetical protein PYX00_008166 [Menopon gallinae]|uniref:Uncharacterized protein n=1 Tax=Menopon gallinae TaxID=328185 RepID=A0AAW2HLY7_9NEOP
MSAEGRHQVPGDPSGFREERHLLHLLPRESGPQVLPPGTGLQPGNQSLPISVPVRFDVFKEEI